MVKRRLGLVALLLCLLLCPARAISVDEAKEPVSVDRACSLSMDFGFPDLSVKLYQIAEASESCFYTLCPAFEASDLMLNGVQSNGEWNVIRSTLETYILASATGEDLRTVTDEEGTAHFYGLTAGLYLIVSEDAVQGEQVYRFASALVALPDLGEDGFWQYDVAVTAKWELIPPVEPEKEVEYKVLKLWKGSDTHRPDRIDVEIFRNGISHAWVTLSEENNWSYSWRAPQDGAVWKVAERNIPEGYTVTVEERETTFLLTNTKEGPDTPPPDTGDRSHVLLYIILLNVSGMALLILGLTGKRKRA